MTDQKKNLPLLTAFAHMIKKGYIEMDITLSVNGTIISGLAVPLERYLKETAVEARRRGQGAASTFADGIEETIQVLRSNVDNEEENEEEENAENGGEVEFIYLINATIAIGNELLADSTPWEVRLSSVDAFALGQVTNR